MRDLVEHSGESRKNGLVVSDIENIEQETRAVALEGPVIHA